MCEEGIDAASRERGVNIDLIRYWRSALVHTCSWVFTFRLLGRSSPLETLAVGLTIRYCSCAPKASPPVTRYIHHTLPDLHTFSLALSRHMPIGFPIQQALADRHQEAVRMRAPSTVSFLYLTSL